MIRTARRKVSLPSIWIVPPCSQLMRWTSEPSAPTSKPSRSPSSSVASRTTAPAPSPKRTAIVRSYQSSHRERCSAPTSRTRLRARREQPARDPQAVHEAAARRVEVHRGAVGAEGLLEHRGGGGDQAVRRRGREQDRVERRRRRRPARSSAARGRDEPEDEALPPTRRSRIPVRSAIHSSDVSRVSDSSSLVTIALGERRCPSRSVGAPGTALPAREGHDASLGGGSARDRVPLGHLDDRERAPRDADRASVARR